MGKINVLSFAVANLIAAGEVVDRPSSVIKELLENAIDSGADNITVEIQNGGVTYMRVTDNGCGISKDDLPVAIRRHATSKIKDAEDLNGILTLGFRGEALAAIASVSDMRIISKQKENAMGAMLEASGGNILGVTDRPCADGTTVIVENLFANVPARKKFLKKDVTEAMSVSAVVEKIALSRPDIFFKLIIDGNVKIETTGDKSLKNTVYAVFGREFATKLIDVNFSSDGISVKGFVGRPDNIRANRNYQNFFINGRYVKSRTAMAALEQAYTSYIASERFPCCILFLDIDPTLVDVNVHPAKLEVKFSNEKPVFETVYYAVRGALEGNMARPDVVLPSNNRKVSDAYVPIEDGRRESARSQQIQAELYRKATPNAASNPLQTPATPQKPNNENSYFAHVTAEEYKKSFAGGNQGGATMPSRNNQSALQPTPTVQSPPQKAFEPLKSTEQVRATEIARSTETVRISESVVSETKPIVVPTPTVTQTASVPEPVSAPQYNVKPSSALESLHYRIVGEVFNSYVIVERGSEILLIDKHAAHERIIFEQLKAGLKDAKINSQMLMLPIEIMMTSDEIQAMCDYRAEVEAVGFEFSVGKYAISVTAIPEGIDSEGIVDMILVMAERIRSGTGSAGLTKDIVFEKALYQASCKAAIKAGREYSKEQIKRIVDKLMELPDITVCPHGRPVAMILDKKNLDRQFERT